MGIIRLNITLIAATLSLPILAKTPCEGLTSKLSAAGQINWSAAIANQLQATTVDLLAVYGTAQWRIVYVDTHQADPVFLFYEGEPDSTQYTKLWSGAAMRSESGVIEEWALKHVPGIPKALASCFAWYVTVGR